MPNTILTELLIREEIMSRLGGSQVEVELTQTDLNVATREAVRAFTRYRPQVKYRALAATKAQKRYVLSTVDHPGLVGVLDVQFLTRRTTPGEIDVFDPTTFAPSTILGGGGTYGDINQSISYMEDASRIASAEPEWHAGWEGSVFALYVDIVRDGVKCSYAWTSNWTADTNPNTGMALIPDQDTDWILNYIEARCKKTLGMVRRKHGGTPNSEGSTDETDGQTLVDEGQVAMEALVEDLRQRSLIIPPVIE